MAVGSGMKGFFIGAYLADLHGELKMGKEKEVQLMVLFGAAKLWVFYTANTRPDECCTGWVHEVRERKGRAIRMTVPQD